ncbi:hypothetical protein QR680_013926 [Steinernema hermaphroditum]|uniref:Uncharacterized protein n=1 Tax=Steinernema hermaphroditum TaxID=289476 RepID=A0AA39M2D3_9BILA|nr:hypothetical protein QR680_013926 [Steinernema hermaphroditum]
MVVVISIVVAAIAAASAALINRRCRRAVLSHIARAAFVWQRHLSPGVVLIEGAVIVMDGGQFTPKCWLLLPSGEVNPDLVYFPVVRFPRIKD